MSSIGYHLRTFAIGVPILAALVGVIYLVSLLPLWLAEAPLLVFVAYSIGRLIELWTRR